MTTAARQHSHPALKETERSRSARRKLARLRHIHPPSHAQHLALVEEVRAGRRSKYMRDRLPACLPHLRAFALSLTRDPVRSDDLVQSTLLRAWANLDHFQPTPILRHGCSPSCATASTPSIASTDGRSRTRTADSPDA